MSFYINITGIRPDNRGQQFRAGPFPTLAAAQADMAAHPGSNGVIVDASGNPVSGNYGNANVNYGGRTAASRTPSQPAQPTSPSGWWTVRNGNRSYTFSNYALAQRCQQSVGGRLEARAQAPDMQWRNTFDQRGPNYT